MIARRVPDVVELDGRLPVPRHDTDERATPYERADTANARATERRFLIVILSLRRIAPLPR
jgi:hypothetical protein